MKIKVLSLFDGISVAQQALKELGYDVEYYASEIDKYAKIITEARHPQTIQLGDVKNVGFITKMGEDTFGDLVVYLDNVDLLIGGSPCQDLSIAKKNRQGLDGARSGLFWEYVRILKEVKPKYFVLENVNSMPKEAKAIITEALGVEPIMINASLVSAQNRKRLFWTNIPNVTQPEDMGILLKDILEKDVDEKYNVKSVDFIKGGTNKKTDLDFLGGIRNKDWAKDGKNYSRNFGQGDRVYSPNGKSTTLSALGGGRGAKTGLYLMNHKMADKKHHTEKSPTLLQSHYKEPLTVHSDTIIRKLTPIECERLQSLPDNYTEGISNTQRYKCLGNAFNCAVVKHILSFMKL